MSSRQPNKLHHTLAFRLTFWYACLFTISSLVTFTFFYFFITTVIRNQTDQELRKQAGVFSSMLAVNGLETVERDLDRLQSLLGQFEVFPFLEVQEAPEGAVDQALALLYLQALSCRPVVPVA